jgi:hypothetical protein
MTFLDGSGKELVATKTYERIGREEKKPFALKACLEILVDMASVIFDNFNFANFVGRSQPISSDWI